MNKSVLLSPLVIALLLAGATVASVAGAIQLGLITLPSSVTVTTTGTIVAFQSGGVTPLTSIPFGSHPPGSNPTFTVVIKNTGNVPVTLTKSTTSPFDINWDYSGTIAPNTPKTIILTIVIPVSAAPATHDFTIDFISSG